MEDTAFHDAVTTVFREEASRVVTAIMRSVGNFDLAEEATQDALLEALEAWPREGIPRRPGAWLVTVARRRAIDRIRRTSKLQQRLPLIPTETATGEPDDRLRLIFTCCHPALNRAGQVALTLRAVLGLTTAEIAAAFLTTEATVAQRIVRAKRKIVDAGIPYGLSDEAQLRDRLDEVLAVLYLTFNEGYLSAGWDASGRRDLAEDARWLAALVVRLMPREPEPMGLLALMSLHLARWRARFDDEGDLVILREQNRSLWDRGAIANACALLETAAAVGRPGSYQLQAAIAAVHAESPTYDATDWVQIVTLYDMLARHDGSPVVRLNRAIALREIAGADVALREVDAIAGELDRYHLLHATRAELLSDLNRMDDSRAALERALELTLNQAERRLLRRRLAKLESDSKVTRRAG
ncbi:MAG: RNA polymerase sigma factor [Candidatus Dormibacteria bacterium]